MGYVTINDITWSSSRLTTHWGCPLGYYFNYIKKIKVPKSPQLAFGGSIHRILDRFYSEDKTKITRFKSPESFANQWKGLWFMEAFCIQKPKKSKTVSKRQLPLFENEIEPKKEYMLNPAIKFKDKSEPFIYAKIGEDILKKFYVDNINRKKPDLLEEEINFEFRGHKFIAKIDRVENLDSEPIILDYKSDKNPPSELTVKRHPQLTIYFLGLMAKYNKEPKRVGIYHLRTGNILYAERKESDFDYIDSLVTRIKKEVADEDFTPFYGKHCDYMCDFVDVCANTTIKKIEENGKEKSQVIINYPKIDWNEINNSRIDVKRVLQELKYNRFKTDSNKKQLELVSNETNS